MPGIDEIGATNVNQGVCGFTSALYALYTHSPVLKKKSLAGKAKWEIRVAAEIKTYLKILEAEHAVKLLRDIADFTLSFPNMGHFDRDKFTDQYIERIDKIPLMKGLDQTETAPLKEGYLDIAMPPQAVVDYLRRVCDLRNARIVDKDTGQKELIIGLRDDTGKRKLHKGLRHYVYRYEGTVYSWGHRFGSAQEAGKLISAETPCLYISPTG